MRCADGLANSDFSAADEVFLRVFELSEVHLCHIRFVVEWHRPNCDWTDDESAGLSAPDRGP